MEATDAAPGDPGRNEDRLRAVAWRLGVDHWTAEVVRALRAAGVEPVLLKGPAVADWLYDDRSERSYTDADVLVAPGDRATTRRVLEEIGFARMTPSFDEPRPGHRPSHAETWFRDRGTAAVDLHRSLHGLEHLDDHRVWDAVTRDRERIEVAGEPVEVPSAVVRTLHTVLHLQPKDAPGTKAWTDLERAISRVPAATWTDAAELAADLGVADTMGALLRLVPDGAPLADRLGLRADAPDWLVRAHRRHVPGLVRFAHRLRDGTPREAARAVRMKVAPPPARVRDTYPLARRGPLGLAATYAWRVLRVPAVAVDAARHRRDRARRDPAASRLR